MKSWVLLIGIDLMLAGGGCMIALDYVATKFSVTDSLFLAKLQTCIQHPCLLWGGLVLLFMAGH
jgi:hypothetical protein